MTSTTLGWCISLLHTNCARCRDGNSLEPSYFIICKTHPTLKSYNFHHLTSISSQVSTRSFLTACITQMNILYMKIECKNYILLLGPHSQSNMHDIHCHYWCLQKTYVIYKAYFQKSTICAQWIAIIIIMSMWCCDVTYMETGVCRHQ